jgi:hypothetical protein
MTRHVARRSLHAAASVAVTTVACAGRVARAPSAPSAPSVVPVVVPIRVVNNHVHLRMSSGGRDVSLIYDTGAGSTLLDLPVAERLGFRLGQAVNIGGAGPTAMRGFRLAGGTLVLPQDSSISVTPGIAFPMSLGAFEGIPVNGILGADFTAQSVVQLDYARQRMTLHPRTFRYAGDGVRLPLTFKEGQPHTVGEVVLADGARLSADCLIDVGASAALILTKPFVEKHRLLERVGPTVRRKAGRGVGGSAWATIGRVAAVRLGAAELREPITGLYGDSAGVFSTDRSFECNVGGDILRRFVVYLDYGRKEMILEPTAAVTDPFEADMSGAAFRTDTVAAGIRVTDVMPRGPAEAAGLREDDLLVSIDGRPALAFGLDALKRRFRRSGGEVELTVRRAQTDRVIVLPVRRLI